MTQSGVPNDGWSGPGAVELLRRKGSWSSDVESPGRSTRPLGRQQDCPIRLFAHPINMLGKGQWLILI